MSGPRVSTGTDSKQDYATDPAFIVAVEQRFGPIGFDLAAHAGNKKHPRYFAPREFVVTTGSKKTGDLVVTRTPNVDPEAVALDALTQPWRDLRADGLLWLNPEFSDITPWAQKCAAEQSNITMLVPAAVGSNWYRDHVAPFADVYLLNGRLCFDGANLFPKDCLLAHYHGGPPSLRIWEWRKNRIHGAVLRGGA